MAEYNIFRRGVQTRQSQRLTFVCSVMAKDAVDAMLKFCGQKSNCTFMYGWYHTCDINRNKSDTGEE